MSFASGTFPGMPAFEAGNGTWKNKKKSSSGGKNNSGSGGKNGSSKKSKDKSSKKKDKKTDSLLETFKKKLEKLFDWIEVRLDRVQRRIDQATQAAENAVGYLTKNANINVAMDETRSLISNNEQGAVRYGKQAEDVLTTALNTKVKKGKNKGKALITAAQAQEIREKVADGTIDISKYSERVREVISNYRDWYEKSLDCQQAVGELQAQLKELQQTKLDNITEEFESWVNYFSAIKDTSQAIIDYYDATGRAINTVDKAQYNTQIQKQNDVTNKLAEEMRAYQAEMNNAAIVFGTASNEYRAAQTQLESISKQWYESQTTLRQLQRTAYELNANVRTYFIDRVKMFVDKLSSIAGLAEKRGTTSKYGRQTQVTEEMYSEQKAYNVDLILKYSEDIKDRKKEIAKRGDEISGKEYEELYKIISDDEQAIMQLLSANEDLDESIRNLRWKPYAELREELDKVSSDLDHIASFIRDGEILDEDGQLTDRGYTQIALIGEQMDVAEKKIRNAEEAIAKLNEERGNYTISLEKYNEELETQLGIIQDAAGDLFDDQTKLADIYIDHITKENDVLQDLIQSRRDALDAKKEYYNFDKTLKNKNKDIAQLQAQINALQNTTNDSAKARRAKLEAELQQQQEDLQDTLYDHMIEVQMEGYDKLSDDMNEALQKAIDAINGKQDVLNDIAGQMLTSLKGHSGDVSAIIEGIVEGTGTKLHEKLQQTDATTDVLENVTSEKGIDDLLKDLGASWNGVDIKSAIETRIPENAVANIDTKLGDILDSLGNDKSDEIEEIEKALGTLAETQEEKDEREEKIKSVKEQIDSQQTKIEKQKNLIARYEEEKSHTGNATYKEKMDRKIKDANSKISTYESNIKNLKNKLDELGYTGTTGETARGEKNIGGADAERVIELGEQIKKLNEEIAKKNDVVTQATASKTSLENDISSYETNIQNHRTIGNNYESQAAQYTAQAKQLTEQAKTKKKGSAARAQLVAQRDNANNMAIDAHNQALSYLSVANQLEAGYNAYVAPKVEGINQASKAINEAQEELSELNQMLAELQKEYEELTKIEVDDSYASGSKRINKKQLAWTNEDLDKVGSEIIVRPSDGAILTPLKAGDSVIPANLADNLFKWGAISPDQFATNPFMGKWDAQGGSIGGGDNIVNMPQQVQLSFDSLFHIEGNVDAEMMPRLENLGKSLVNNKEFQKNVIKFVTKDFVRESKKQGIR